MIGRKTIPGVLPVAVRYKKPLLPKIFIGLSKYWCTFSLLSKFYRNKTVCI